MSQYSGARQKLKGIKILIFEYLEAHDSDVKDCGVLGCEVM
jgi:hypothetical protein